MLAKCANIWLSRQHVADMSATFPAKILGELIELYESIEIGDPEF